MFWCFSAQIGSRRGLLDQENGSLMEIDDEEQVISVSLDKTIWCVV